MIRTVGILFAIILYIASEPRQNPVSIINIALRYDLNEIKKLRLIDMLELEKYLDKNQILIARIVKYNYDLV